MFYRLICRTCFSKTILQYTQIKKKTVLYNFKHMFSTFDTLFVYLYYTTVVRFKVWLPYNIIICTTPAGNYSLCSHSGRAHL